MPMIQVGKQLYINNYLRYLVFVVGIVNMWITLLGLVFLHKAWERYLGYPNIFCLHPNIRTAQLWKYA